MLKRIKEWIDWLRRAETIYMVLKVWLGPAVLSVLTVWLGYIEKQPWMWISMATALVFGAICTGILRISEYRERKNPANRLIYQATEFSCALNEVPMPRSGNREQRRSARAQQAHTLTPNQLHPMAVRKLETGQISVSVKNTASFPISLIAFSATTSIEDFTPPRSTYPKQAKLLGPGERVRISDDSIDLEETDCGPLTGEMNFLLKYGLPGDEVHELRLHGKIHVQMERFGFVTGVMTNWEA